MNKPLISRTKVNVSEATYSEGMCGWRRLLKNLARRQGGASRFKGTSYDQVFKMSYILSIVRTEVYLLTRFFLCVCRRA